MLAATKFILKKISEVSDLAQCFVKKWWRPATQVGLAASIWTNGVIVPLMTKTPPDLTGLSLLVTSVVAAFGIRAWEKHKGIA